jgi:hypothetical protein
MHYKDGLSGPTAQILDRNVGNTDIEERRGERSFHFNLPANRGRWFMVDLVLQMVDENGTEIALGEQGLMSLLGWSVGVAEESEISGDDN